MDSKTLQINYQFKNPDTLARVLRHPSLPFEGPSFYQRCEFLGDRVLGLIIADYLLQRYPAEHEGVLSKQLSNLVRRESLAKVGERINLGKVVQMAESEEVSGGRHNLSILGDGCEALIGAIYTDGGLEAAKAFILEAWSFLFEEVDHMEELDAKTALQEYLQKRGKSLPQYSVRDIQGPAHAPFFTVQVKITGHEPEIGQGYSKRQAEQEAAGKMMARLTPHLTPKENL
ncbi:MAG: ribonuclease III [Alphaproteobacteria bacterium]